MLKEEVVYITPYKRFHDHEIEVAIDKDTGPVEIIEKSFILFADRMNLKKVEDINDILNFRIRRFKKFTYDEFFFVAFLGKNSVEVALTKEHGWSRRKDLNAVTRYGKKTAEQIADDMIVKFQQLFDRIKEQS